VLDPANMPSRSLRGRNIVVTGGAGFIGSHMVDALIAEGAGDITILDNFFLGKEVNLAQARTARPDVRVARIDAADEAAVRALFREIPPVDVVFDLAVIPLPTSLERPKWCFDENVQITSTLCELLREGVFGSLFHFSSSEAYGSARTVPMREDHPLEPLTPYAASKVASDVLVRTYIATFGVNAQVVRPFNNYGPRQNDREYAGVIPICLRCAMEGTPFTLFGDGEQTRDYIYVTDTVRAALTLYGTPAAQGHVVNIGSGTQIRIIDLVEKIQALVGRPIHIERKPPRPGDVMRHQAGTALLHELTGFTPQVDIDTGLARTVEWYRQNLSTAQVG
jgi:UDP-glucose 4-epimerase